MNRVTLAALIVFPLTGIGNSEVFMMSRVPAIDTTDRRTMSGIIDREIKTRGLAECAVVCHQSELCDTIRFDSSSSWCIIIRNETNPDFNYKGKKLGKAFKFRKSKAPSYCTVDSYIYVWELNICMKFYFVGLTTWSDAENTCINEGGHLLSTEYLLKSIIVASYYKQLQELYGIEGKTYRWWIGLTDMEEEGEFIWVTGLPLTSFNSWTGQQPDNKSGNYPSQPANCVSMVLSTTRVNWWLWYDRACIGQLSFTCERKGY